VDDEAPAKNYQIKSINNSIDRIAKTVERIESKIDTQLVTKEKLADVEKSIHMEYSPMKRNQSRLFWAVVTTLVPAIIYGALQFISNSHIVLASH